jgi:hypothetical protein
MSRGLARARGRALLGALALLVSSAACRDRGLGEEGARTKEAFEKFIDFGMSNERYDLGRRETRGPPAKVRSREVNNLMSPRLRLEVEIELPYDLTGRALEEALLDNARGALAGTEFLAVRVKAWPGPLKRFGGTMGYAVMAIDGQGWDGERMGYREVKVTLGDAVRRPNPLDYQILCALELEAAALELKLKPPQARSKAQANIAKTLGLQVEGVRHAVGKVEAYYLKE